MATGSPPRKPTDDREPKPESETKDELEELRSELHALRDRLQGFEKTERALAEAKARAGAVLTAAVDGILTIDESGALESANPAACDMFGYTREELVGQNVKLLMPPPFRDEHDEYLARYRRTAQKKIIGLGREVLGLRKDGSSFPIELSVGEAYAGDRRIFSGIIRDLTASRALMETVARLRRSHEGILNSAEEGIYGLDADGLITFVNPAATRMLGWEAQELVGKREHELLHRSESGAPHPRDACPMCAAFLSERVHAVREGRIWRKDGTCFPAESVSTPTLEGPEFTGAVVAFSDITRRREAEDRRASLGQILEESRNEIFVFDDTTLKFRLVNREARRNLGLSLEELRQMTPVDIKPEFDERLFRELLEPLRRQERETIEFRTRHERRDGTQYPVDVRLQYARSENEFVAIIFDVTDRLELEDQLQQAQKMEAIGTLAGGVAHDFNNLLTSIQGSAELILRRTETEGSVARSATRIMKAVARGAALTQQLLALGRKQIIRPEVLDLDRAIQESAQLFERMIGEDIALEWRLAGTPGSIRFDPAQFDQVVINLVVNARDAMPKGGRLTLSTGFEEVPPARARALEIPPGPYHWLSIADTGAGIPAAALPNIFDPFFTTKEAGKGTGLGLSTVHGIVRRHGGAITVESEADRGTTFKLFLPHCEDVPRQEGALRSPARPTREQREVAARVLVIEDDQTLRDLLNEVLRESGYTVLEAGDAEAALALGREHAGAIDLVVSDMVVPGGSGFELAKQLERHCPGVALLFMSGYTDQVLADRGQLSEEDAFIRKPFGNDELLEKVGELLARR